MNEIQKRITFTIFSILICFCFVSLLYGKFFIDIDIILNLFFSKLGITNNSIYSNEQDLIIFEVRLPRIVLTALVGGSLSISGAVLQSVFKNPLVSPFILGVSSGASFGVSIIIFFFSTYNVFILQLFAFTFGFLAVFFVILSSHLFSSRNSVILVLSGIIVSSFFTSLVSLVQYFSEEQKLQSILFWTFGSFSNSSWENILVIFPICSLCFLFLIAQSWKINVLSLGEDESKLLGIDTNKFRMILILITTLLTSSVTAVCGPIGWVGLLIPHIVRFIGGANNFYVVINSFLLGAVFLQAVDLIARNLSFGEIPIGIATSIIGLPFFMFILYKNRTSH